MNSRSNVSLSAVLAAVPAMVVAGILHAQTVPEVEPDLPAVVIESEAQPSPDTAFGEALMGEIAALGSEQGGAVDAFYAARGYEPFWTEPTQDRLGELRAALEGVEKHGLPYLRYNADALGLMAEAEADEERPALEIAATRAYLKLTGDLTAGFVTPSRVDAEINLRPRRVADEELLSRLGEGQSVAAVLRATEPGDRSYRKLMAEAERLKGMLDTGVWGEEVAEGPTMRMGESSPRVPQLRERLTRLGYSAEVEPGAEAAFDEALHEAVLAFQGDYGLVDDGAAGRRTLAALNASVESRLRQVLVNLERMRWMNQDLGERRIEVNIPDYTATLYDGEAELWHSKVVVGKTDDTRTPEFTDEMTYLVVNPTWHIPDSIATRVYLPKLRRDPSVLSRSGMRLFTRSGTEINPALVNFSQYSASNFPFRVKQNPSTANALGRVKFMFPNQFSIYLHDTPARNLFAKDARAFSNGCIRLEQPIELAEVLLSGQYGDPGQAFDGWLAAKSERHVNLETPVDVHILYRTVWAEPDGAIRYRADIYGRDRSVFRAMEAEGVRIRAAEG